MATIQQICPDAATEPATAATLQALRDEKKIDCPICTFPFAELLTDDAQPNADDDDDTTTDPITLQACNHTYCKACVIKWIHQAPTEAISCPLCRAHIGTRLPTPQAYLAENAATFARAQGRRARFGAAFIAAAAAVAAAYNNDAPVPTLRFTAEQIFTAGGRLIGLMSDVINNFPPPPPPLEDGTQLRVLLPAFGSPRFLRFVSSLPPAALSVVRRLGGHHQQQQQQQDQQWQVAARATVVQLRRLLLLKLFELYLERFGINVPGAGEMPGGVVSHWQRGMQAVLEEIIDTGMPANATLHADRTLLEVDRYVRMVIGVILVVGDDENGGFQAVAA